MGYVRDVVMEVFTLKGLFIRGWGRGEGWG